MKALFPDVDAYNMQEAELFNIYLNRKFGLSADYLETTSTNCGNNITNLLELLEKNNIPCKSIILSQDATMQRRMSAVMRKYRPELQIINYATYAGKPHGTWADLEAVIPDMRDESILEVETVKLGMFQGFETIKYIEDIESLYEAFCTLAP